MAIKRKGASTIAKRVAGGASRAKVEKEVEEQDAHMEHQEEEEEVEETEELSEEQIQAKRDKEEKQAEKETVAAREKELKSMYADALKKLTESKSLQNGKRDDMIKAILKAEAKERAQQREHEAAIRAAVTKKKQELEALSAPELKRLCAEKEIKGSLSKVERVETLLKLWVEDDGINKAQLQQARDERAAELNAMEKQALRKICEQAGIEVFLRDVMVDRVVNFETEKGNFLKPESNLAHDLAESTPKVASKASLVDALLMKQKEDKEKSDKEAEEAAKLAQKIKELQKKSIDDLKKVLTKRKLTVAGGKKDEMVKALVDADIAENAAAEIKAKLTSMASEEIAKLLAARGRATSKSKTIMVDALLAHEADVQLRLKAYEAKRSEVAAKEKDALQSKTASELKEMCAEKGISAGVGKEERVNRLIEAALQTGGFDTNTAKTLRTERKQFLESMDKAALVKLCEDLGIDTLVKEVMVERILSHEAEIGEPLAKKARKSNN
jgi:myosin heavy subunit